MQDEANEGGMSVEQLAALLNNDPSNDPKAEPAKEPTAEQEVEDTESAASDGDTPDDADEQEPSLEVKTDEGDDDGEQDKPKRLSGSARLRAQNERLRAELEALRGAVPIAPKEADPEAALNGEISRHLGEPPKEADFGGDYLAYERAVTAYRTAELIMRPQLQAAAQRAQEARKQAMQERVSDFFDAADGLAKRLPDIRDVFDRMPATSETVAELMLDDAEKGPLVAYYLGKNPQAAARLARMSPMQQAAEYGRLSASISLPKPKAATQASKPAPIAPVKGSAKPSRGIEDLPMDDFAKRLLRDVKKAG